MLWAVIRMKPLNKALLMSNHSNDDDDDDDDWVFHVPFNII